MSVSLLLGLVYLISELLLTVTRRSRSRTGTKQDRSTLRVVWLRHLCGVGAGGLCGETLAGCGAAASSKLCHRGRGAVCRWTASALVGHYHARPLFHRGRDD